MTDGADEAWYAAFKAKDARFDGRFFVGVSSTGIYCRPVCKAKLPKPENCSFFSSAAEAEQAGFRPCLLCRPELAPSSPAGASLGASVGVGSGAAPGTASVDATASLARRAARLLEDNCGNEQSLEAFAERLGCSDRHLRRAFMAEYNVSPVRYLQTCRLLLAKKLLTDTGLSVTDVAMAAGFGSLRRFNDLFKARYRMAPNALRRQESAGLTRDAGEITVALAYRPPYLWRRILDFLAQRAIPGVEAVCGDEYQRTVRFAAEGGQCAGGWVRVRQQQEKNVLAVTVSSALLPVLPQVLARVRHLFDLYCDPAAVYETLQTMNAIRPGLCVPGARLPGCFDAFEMAVRAVLGQQITVKAAGTLATRFVRSFGRPVETGLEGLTHVFPPPDDIIALGGPIADHLGPLGITGARARTILGLAEAFARGALDFDACTRPEREIEKLTAIPGIGPWTAQYIAMRALGWPDAFPHTDYGVKKALAPNTESEILKMAEAWRPWRGYATISLWNSL